MKKIAVFAFRDDEICFIHVLLNTLDFVEKGHDACFVFEGGSVILIPKLAQESHPLGKLYARCKEKNLIAGVCVACAKKLDALDAAKEQGLPLLDDMNGHAGTAPFLEKGYEIITL